jgi:hypothetical protein
MLRSCVALKRGQETPDELDRVEHPRGYVVTFAPTVRSSVFLVPLAVPLFFYRPAASKVACA